MNIRVQQGMLGLNSPRQDADAVIVVKRGVYSRTGRTWGNVDAARGVLVQAYTSRPVDRDREVIYSEVLFAPERWDPAARNRLGGAGAFVQQEPAQHEIASAIDRTRAHLESKAPIGGRIRKTVQAA